VEEKNPPNSLFHPKIQAVRRHDQDERLREGEENEVDEDNEENAIGSQKERERHYI